MRLCSDESNQNISFAILNAQVANLYYKNEKGEPDGLYFRLFMENVMWVSYEEMLRNCKFVFVDQVGIYHKENDSYSGGYGLVQQSKVDSFLRLVDYYLKDKFYFSNSGSAISHFATQTIERKIKNNVDSLSYLINFLIPSIEFSSLLIGSLIFYFGFVFFTTKFKLISRFVLRLISLIFIIFLFFIDNLYNSNLNTSNLIVDTSDLITDVNDILKTYKELCVIEKSSADNDFYFNAPKHTLANQLNEKINHNNLCYIANPKENKLGNFLDKGQNKTFVFTYDMGSYYLLKVIQTFYKKDLFISKPIYQTSRALIMSKKISKKARYLIENNIYIALEHNINFFFKNLLKYSSFELVKFGEFAIYDDLQSYIEHFTITRPISFEKLESLFIIYFGFLTLLIFIFLIHHLIDYPINCFKYLGNYLIDKLQNN